MCLRKFITSGIILFLLSIGGHTFKLKEDDSTLEISSIEENFKVVHSNALQLIGDPARVLLSCHSYRDRSRSVQWSYNASELFLGKIRFSRSTNGNFHDMSINLGTERPPVFSVECKLKQSSLSRKTLIYTGVDASPYMYLNGRTVQAIAVNETTVILPCLLKYPVDFAICITHNGKIFDDVNYVPEMGYILDLTKIPDLSSFGTYQCVVYNSTPDDYVKVEVNEGSFIQLRYKGYNPYVFYERSREKQMFECTAPKSMFKTSFRWYLKMANGSLVEFTPQREHLTGHNRPNEFIDLVYITFGTKDITHVVCSVESNTSGIFYKSTRVNIEEITSSVTLEGPIVTNVKYGKGTSLNCSASGHSVKFKWYMDGDTLTGTTIYDWFLSTNLSRTSLPLQPSADDSIVNYTCCGSNDWSQKCKTFIVDVDYELKERTVQVYALGSTLGMIGFIFGIVMVFYKFSCVRRNNLLESKIKTLLNGCRRTTGKTKTFLMSFDESKTFSNESFPKG